METITAIHQRGQDVIRACEDYLRKQGIDLRTVTLKINGEACTPDGECTTIIEIHKKT